MAIMGFGGGALIASPLSRPAAGALRPGVRPGRPGVGRRRAARSTRCSSRSASSTSSFMMFGAFNVRVPGRRLAAGRLSTRARSRRSRWSPRPASRRRNAIRTPQFWLLWVVLFCNVTAGHRHPRAGRPMIQDFFRDGGTSTVTAAAAGRLRRPALAGQHGRPVRLVVDLGRDRPQADLHGLPRASAWCSTSLLALGRAHRDRAVRAAGRA